MAMPHDEPTTGQPRPLSPARRASTLLGVQPWEPPATSPREPLPAPVVEVAPAQPAPRPGAASSHKTTLAGIPSPASLPAHRPRHNVLTSVPTTLAWKPEPAPTPDLATLAGSDHHAPLSEPMPDTEPAPARLSSPQASSLTAAPRAAIALSPALRPTDAGSLDRVSEHDIARVVAVTRFLGAHPVAAITTAVLTSACTLYGAYGLVHHLVRFVSG